ncbi:MAG TPA: PIN domain-containing protein [Verrucomicrobiae bacterium]
MKVVLDTCVLKLATLPNPVNPAALIVELCLAETIRAWASPAMIEEYQEVLADYPELLQRIVSEVEPCYPLTELDVIRHKPDNRFLECALAVPVDFIVTVNTARGHFDQQDYQGVRVLTSGAFVNLPGVQRLAQKHSGAK